MPTGWSWVGTEWGMRALVRSRGGMPPCRKGALWLGERKLVFMTGELTRATLFVGF
jgi:hypothetical protein